MVFAHRSGAARQGFAIVAAQLARACARSSSQGRTCRARKSLRPITHRRCIVVFDVRLAGTGLGRISVAASIGGLVIAIAGCGLADWRRWPTPSWPLASVRQSGESGEPELLARARTGSPLSPDEQRKLVATLQT